MTTRALLRSRLLLAALLALVLVASACGGGDDEGATVDDTAADEAAEESADDPEPVDEEPVDEEPVEEDDAGDDMAEGPAAVVLAAMGFDESENLGAGETWNIGATLSFSGPGAASAEAEKNGIELAVEHIAAAGGPQIVVEYGDNTTGGDPEAAANANANLNEKGIGVKLSDFADGLGAGFPTLAEFQILTLDAAAGTGTGPGVGFDLYWGPRALTPFDGFPGLMAYIAATNPDAATMAVISNDAGPANELNAVFFKDQGASVGLDLSFVELVPFGAQDYSAAVAKVQSEQPDVILLDLHFGAQGGFTRQAINSGIDPATIYSTDLDAFAIVTSQGAYDEAPAVFAGDFVPQLQPNPLAQAVGADYEAVYGAPLDDQAARYYQATLVLWELYVRTLANGGDVNSGPDLQASLLEDPTFVTLWGGTADAATTFTMDPEQHWVNGYPLGVYQYFGGEYSLLATYDIAIDAEGNRSAANFELAG